MREVLAALTKPLMAEITGARSTTGWSSAIRLYPFVNAVVIDPTNSATLYAATSSGGGVFKSTNRGSNWSAVNTGLTVTAGTSTFVPTVNALALDPINPATLYAGTLKGGGVFTSTNGGVTWSAINSGLTVSSGGSTFVLTVNALAIDPTNPTTLYAGTSSGVFKSTDSGNNWNDFSNGLTNTFLHDIVIDPTNPATLYAATSEGIFKSINAAGNWSAANNGSTTLKTNALALDSTTPDHVYAGTSFSSDAFVTATNTDAKTANNAATEVRDVNALPGAVRSGFSANSLARNDDDSTAAIPLGFPVNFFGNSYSSVFVNNNGNVTFDSILSSYTPFSLSSTQRVIIAAFFADVDTRGLASTVVTYGPGVVNGRQAFGVNYINVGYYSSKTDKLNSFQLLLINRSDIAPGNFDIELNYDKIQWETGDSSGGVNGLG